MEAEYFRIAESADHRALVAAADGVGGIEDEAHSASSSKCSQAIDVTGPPPEVDANDGRGGVGDGPLRRMDVDLMSGLIDVAEDRIETHPTERMRGGNEAQAWNHDVSREAESSREHF
jgi:hypothetical protein